MAFDIFIIVIIYMSWNEK